jgi:hypothetical protein
MTAAVDTTLNTDTDYVKMTGASFPWALSYQDNVTWSTDEFILPHAGYYMVSFWAGFLLPAASTRIGVKYIINDTAPYSTQKLIARSASTNDIASTSAMSIIGPVNANDTLGIYVASTVTGNITLQDGGLMVAYLHA